MFYFFLIFLICAALDSIFFFLWFYSINFIVFFPFILHNQVNDPYWISLSTFVSQFYLVLFYLSSLFFPIKLSWSHDIGSMIDMTWTYLMWRSRVSRDSSALSRAIFFLFVIVTIFFIVLLNSSRFNLVNEFL